MRSSYRRCAAGSNAFAASQRPTFRSPDDARMERSVNHSRETELALLSADEIAPALGIDRAPRWAQDLAKTALALPSRPLARVLARLDQRVAEVGLPSAAEEAL